MCGHALGGERRHGERHGDAVVAVRAHLGAAQRPPAVDHEAVGQLLHRGAHAAEALGQGGDAVALLHPQLGGAGEAEGALGPRRGHGQGRHLVDEGRAPRSGATSMPAQARACARSPSPPAPARVRVDLHVDAAPISRSTSRKAVRVGFSSTSSMRTSESARMSAATTRKAALEASPGTSRAPGRRGAPAVHGHGQALAHHTAPRTRGAGAPCGRGWARARGRWCGPRPARPARSTAVFTCALATFSV